MAIIQTGGDSQSLLTIDPVSLAGRAQPMSRLGTNNIPNTSRVGYFTGQKSTYAASMTAKTALTAGVGPFLAIYGSPTKSIRVLRICVAVNLSTTAAYAEVVLNKRVARASAGATAPTTDLVQVSFDNGADPTDFGTASVCALWTGATNTIGAGPSQIIASLSRFAPITLTPADTQTRVSDNGLYDFDFRRGHSTATPPLLLSPSAGIEASFATAPGTAPTIFGFIMWTEE